MPTYLLVSTRPGAGKTAIAAALTDILRRDGKRVVYRKAVETGGSVDGRFMHEVFGSSVAIGAVVDHAAANRLLLDGISVADQVIESLREAATEGDVLLVEGPSSLYEGSGVGLGAVELADALNAKIILVADYRGDQVIDEMIGAKRMLDDRLLGVIVSAVPSKRAEGASDRLGLFATAHDIRLIGVMPYDERLTALSVRDVTTQLNGEILVAPEAADVLIENIMVGTVVLGKASDYFRRRSKKLVIAPGHRPDMHLAALETDTRCIVLCGNIVPNPIVAARAEEEGIPLVVVKQDTLTVLEQIEQLHPNGRFSQPAKLPVISELATKHLNLEGIRAAATV